MVILILIFVALLAATVGVGVLGHRSRLLRIGGPTTWGRAIAKRFGPIPGAIGIAVVGWIVTLVLLYPLGRLAWSLEESVDEAVFAWISGSVGDSAFTTLNEHVTTLGDRSVNYVTCGIAILVLAFAYGRRRWWIPVIALVAAMTAQVVGQDILTALVPREPPVPGVGVFPSGGVSRLMTEDSVIVMLAILLIPTLSRAWRSGLWIGVFAFGMIEGYTRLYLSLHWITDVLGGIVYGTLMVLIFTTATVALATDTTGSLGDGTGARSKARTAHRTTRRTPDRDRGRTPH